MNKFLRGYVHARYASMQIDQLSMPCIPKFIFQRSFISLLISLSVSRFFIVSRLSRFFFPLTKAISTLIFLPLLYTEIGTIVKLLFFSLPASSAISFLDADLQNDPFDIPRFLEKMDEGYDAVFGWRKEKKFSRARRFYSGAANRVINFVFSYPYHDVGCSARVVKRSFLKDMPLYGELHRILPVLIYLKGAKIGEIVVQHRPRMAGQSKYGFNRIVKTLIDIITVKFISSYGTKPAYVFGSFGLGSMALGALALILTTYQKLFLGVFVHRNPIFLIAIFLGFLGVQFMLMGFLAELQVRTYFESQGKSIYEVKDIEKF